MRKYFLKVTIVYGANFCFFTIVPKQQNFVIYAEIIMTLMRVT